MKRCLRWVVCVVLLLISLQTAGFAQEAMKAGDVYEAPNQVFKVVFKEPGTRTFAKFVADNLQDAWIVYNRDFVRDDGKAPLAWMSPTHRMEVQIVSGSAGTNAEYKFLSRDGYIIVDRKIGERDLPGLKITLYHELFHAVQDAYSAMSISGTLAHWWFEATAEWAGLKYGSKFTDREIRDEMGRYPSFLSVAVQESGNFEEGLMPYAFSAMIAHAQSKQPDYVRKALNGSSVSSGAFYEGLIKAADFPKSFPEYVGNYLSIGRVVPGLRTSVRVLEFSRERRLYRAPDDNPAAIANPQLERVIDPAQLAAPLKFRSKTPLKPLTARLYSVSSTDTAMSRNVTMTLRQMSPAGAAEPGGIIAISVPRAPNLKPTVTKVSSAANKGATIFGVGKDVAEVYIAVYNPDPQQAMDYDLTVDFNQNAVAGGAFLLQTPSFQVLDPNSREMKNGQSQSTPTSKWKIDASGMTFDSTRDAGFHLKATFSQPPASLKQGDSFVVDLTIVADGERDAKITLGPVGPINEWELEVLDPGPNLKTFPDRTTLLTIPTGKGKRTATLRIKVTLAGAATTTNLKTGASTGPRLPITVDELVLEVNVSGLATIDWVFKRAAP